MRIPRMFLWWGGGVNPFTSCFLLLITSQHLRLTSAAALSSTTSPSTTSAPDNTHPSLESSNQPLMTFTTHETTSSTVETTDQPPTTQSTPKTQLSRVDDTATTTVKSIEKTTLETRQTTQIVRRQKKTRKPSPKPTPTMLPETVSTMLSKTVSTMMPKMLPPVKISTVSTSTTSQTTLVSVEETTPTTTLVSVPTTTLSPVVTEPEYYKEKVESLGCKMLPLPPQATIWKGNQTHELNLPNQNSNELCGSSPCGAWDGVRDMQSGDVLLVRIDDAQLIQDKTKDPRASVYQVTRGGRDSCDVTEGVLLDISPLQSEEKTLVALYDRDLTEGANLLIIVSEAWGSQCVRLSVTVKSDNCGDDQDCSGKGLCFSNDSMESYECQCCSGFIGPHCEEKDACFPSPCRNNGICVDISQGHDGNTFQCLCPYGFTGKTCEDTSNPCESGPCQNGGSCTASNLTAQQFKCLCPPGFSGSLCQHNMDDCASSPCGHGICVDQTVGYRCYCQPGFSGEQCQFEYNECESSPCLNGGSCADHIGRFSCTCGHGYTGQRCQIKVDLCDPNPCSHRHYCVDKGNTFACECPKGFQGPNCDVAGIVSCSHNPCLNGGTCWSSIDSFYCSCPPSFTGQICNVELLMDEVSNEVEGGINSIIAESEKPSMDLQMPISIHLDHLHSIYVAAGTLACALLIVIITVTICHCKMHGTHKKIYIFLCRRKPCEDKKPNGLLNRNRFVPPMDIKPVRKMFPCFDSSEMYYGLDFSDSQSSPLIQ
uniref:Delta and Notch-like epidermal growth factor-related receptor n=1 Tax=Cacopsylla melanoneura TaxID=428564 RepID=A0A8D8V766_9HEMI